jgi:hypothetical protein
MPGHDPLLRWLKLSQVLVTPACNPSYSEGRDQEDRSSKPARANSFARPYLKKKKTLSQKRASRVAQAVGPQFKSQYQKKKNG